VKRKWFRGVDDLVLEAGVVTAMAVFGLLVTSHAVHTQIAATLETKPIIGPLVRGIGVAIDSIVTPS